MGVMRKFLGVQTATTAGAAGVINSKLVPIKNARCVRAYVRSGTAESPASATFEVGNHPSVTPSNLAPAGQGYTIRGTVSAVTIEKGSGQSMIMSMADAALPMTHDWARFVVTASAGGLAGPVAIDVEVVFDSEAMRDASETEYPAAI